MIDPAWPRFLDYATTRGAIVAEQFGKGYTNMAEVLGVRGGKPLA